MYLCSCRGISDAEVRKVGREGTVAPAALIEVLELNDASCCGRCAADIEVFVALAWEGAAEPVPVRRSERVRRVQPGFA